MENAADALKMAFAVFVFVMALSLAIYMFSQARTTADAVLYASDSTRFVDYEEARVDPTTGAIIGEDRIVGLETIIPTLYKYYKENYTVIFRGRSGTSLKLYDTQTNVDLWSTGYINKYYPNNRDLRICSFDVDEETRRHEPWTGNRENYKKNLDAFLSGGKYKYTTSNADAITGSVNREYDYSANFSAGSFMEQYRNTKFKENLGEYIYNASTAENAEAKKKRVIIYTIL